MATLLTLPLFPLVFFPVVLFPGLPATFPLLEEEVGFKESDLLGTDLEILIQDLHQIYGELYDRFYKDLLYR